MKTIADISNFPGERCDPFVIAEIGVNHDGDPDRAVELVDHAAEAGADAIKVQWFKAAQLVSRSATLASYQLESGEEDVVSMLERLELDADAMNRVIRRARHHGLLAVATVFSAELVPDATELDWDLFKTASPDIINRPLLEALAGTGRPLILSTGGSTLAEITEALGWIETSQCALLHCVSSYPTPPEQAALGGIRALGERFHLPIGYSDHTPGWETGGLAVACGATILEKHLTWDVQARGPDHATSLSPELFGRYVRFARSSARMIGSTDKKVLPIEIGVRDNARQSIAAVRDLAIGDRLEPGDLTTMRPGHGMKPSALPELYGREVVRPIERGDLILPEHLLPLEACT
jgi:N,N'-diacetyllegionaminate synthase